MRDILARDFAEAAEKKRQASIQKSKVEDEIVQFSKAYRALIDDVEAWLKGLGDDCDVSTSSQARDIHDTILGSVTTYRMDVFRISRDGKAIELLPLLWSGRPSDSKGVVTLGEAGVAVPLLVSLGDQSGWGTRRCWMSSRGLTAIEQATDFNAEIFYRVVKSVFFPKG
ncbi:hypothetical protein N7414_23030 [Pseudomonas sp. GD04087]|uniref:hypothetical protein n=1 Tax=unclassified Pseudomonas TaxID=196821 RepID=UPI00244A066A|nr:MULTISPECIES: hypothetical protein [unclassified Pseudomonas]MDH0292009.1 hypothetical protein [Pseudomonas sp. GD04087]MDH1052857.1 hypothetical protein [Pseudomonas sp. GD03903]MDH2002020.1 hypothetical protein [Pseudomonas sp. GD03691]